MHKFRIGEIFRVALRILGYQLVFGLFGLILTPPLIGLGSAARIPLTLVLIAMVGLFMFMDGANLGQRDRAAGERFEKLLAGETMFAAILVVRVAALIGAGTVHEIDDSTPVVIIMSPRLKAVPEHVAKSAGDAGL